MKNLGTAAALFFLFPVALLAEDKPVETLTEAIELPISFAVERESLLLVANRLTKQVQESLPKDSTLKFEIEIVARDLKFDGFTQNMRIANLDERQQPLRKVLTALVQHANGNTAKDDPSLPGQRLVWAVGPAPENAQQQVVLITTRQGAKNRGLELPEEFVAKSR